MGVRGPVLTTAALAVVTAAAALGMVLGAAPDTGTVTAVTAVTAATPNVPAPAAGRWSGPLRERGGPVVDLRLTLDGARATLDIPAFACRYTGTAPAGGAGVVRLRTVANPQRLCAERATARLSPLGARSLRYELLSTCGRTCTRSTAAALLTAP